VSTPDTGQVHYRVHDGVAVLRLDHPSSRNALTTAVLAGIVDGMDRAEADDDVRVLVITGGPAVFASGADVRELKTISPADYLVAPRQAAWQRVARFDKPSVAAVAGYVLGGGCELALSCDLVVAADNATFGQPEVRLGLLPGAGGTQRWSRAVGRFKAAEVILAARKMDAWAARDVGLVAEVVPPEHLETAALELAVTVAGHGPVATRLARRAVRAAEELPISGGLALEKSFLGTLLSTEDHIEGIDALLEKRPPVWSGR
jgi:enoyl-CoA hydratase/carnithine racemase